MSDRELLQQFQSTGCEVAFRGLVDRYAGLVFAVALRRTRNRSVSEEVAQSVFLILAAKAGRLKSRGELASWLHRTTLLEASNAARKECARQRKMEELVEMTHTTSNPDWPLITPELDQAIDQLKDGDRSAVLLRFYDGLSFREVAASLGKTEAAARQQVSRALSKLSGILRRRGITTSAAVLGTGMAAHLSAATVPTATAVTLSQGALSGAAGVSKITLFINSVNTMAYAKTKTAAAVALLAAIPIGLQWNENRKLREGLAAGEQETAFAEESRLESRKGTMHGRGAGVRRSAAGATVHLPGARTPGVTDWQRALYEQDPVLRSQRLAQLIATLDESSAPGIAEIFFGEGAEKGFESEARLFMRAWAQLDGERAINFLQGKGQTDSANPAVLAALGGWASDNPEAARAWAEGVADDGLREDLLFGVIDGWALADFNAAADYAETRPRSHARTRFIGLLMKRSMANGDIAGAQSWFAGISDNDHNEVYKRRAFEGIVSTMLYRDPSAAAHWIARQAGGEFVSSSAVQSTALKLAESSPEDAMRWLSSMPALDQEISVQGHAGVLSRWAGSDPEAAGNWLGNNMNHPGYDAMARNYSAGVARIDGEGAMNWAQTIQDEEQREAAVISVARQRIRAGGESAIEDLRLAGVTDSQINSARHNNRVFLGNNATMRGFEFAGSGGGSAGGGGAVFMNVDQGDSVDLLLHDHQPVAGQLRNYELASRLHMDMGAMSSQDFTVSQGLTLQLNDAWQNEIETSLSALVIEGVPEVNFEPSSDPVEAGLRFLDVSQSE